ncbi:MAG: bifunctional folylpolyglutamate synthase/dihydrofolate synthase [Bacteroidota bacterium]
MNYKETLDFLYSRLPMFQNLGKVAYKKDLTNTIRLLGFLGNPHLGKQWIHVGGTNGKGSVSSTLASILIENGYSTGLYTSPHLIDFRERIQVDGQLIDQEFVTDFTQRILPILDEIQPSFFELSVAMAFDYFRFKNIDIGVIEVGLGGRLDSTNVISPLFSVITNVSWDHMDLLGDTLTKIAFEKGGIIKENTPIILGPMDNEAHAELQRQAMERNALVIDSAEVDVPVNWTEQFALQGIYQRENLKTIYNATQQINAVFSLNSEKTLLGLRNIAANSGLRGRWEVFSNNPFIVADTAHNFPGVQQTMQQLQTMEFNGKIHIVWGMVSDKDRGKILGLLPKSAKYYFCKPSVMRGLDAKELALESENHGLIGNYFQSVAEAIDAAKTNLTNEDALYIGGSTFVVADALRVL